jgi:hypothetical protein
VSSYGFDCSQLSYLTGFAPMVECVYRDSGLADDEGGDSKMRANETVVLGAHFDSRGVRPTVSLFFFLRILHTPSRGDEVFPVNRKQGSLIFAKTFRRGAGRTVFRVSDCTRSGR